MLTGGFVTGEPALMVHHVEPGSAAEMLELHAADLLVRVDGQPVESVDALARLARAAAERGESLSLVLLRLSGDDALFTFHTRELSPDEIVDVGPAPDGERVAGRR
jgi:S1-C subfamily serine protease